MMITVSNYEGAILARYVLVPFFAFLGMDEVDPLVFPQPVEARHRASLSEASSLTAKPLSMKSSCVLLLICPRNCG